MLEMTKEETASKPRWYEIHIKRNVDGVALTLKSYGLEKFIRSATSKPDTIDYPDALLRSSQTPGILYYHPPLHSLFSSKCRIGDGLYIQNTQSVNLAPILIKGIGEGKTINIKGLYTKSQIQEYIEKFRAGVLEIYREFINPFEDELVVFCEEI